MYQTHLDHFDKITSILYKMYSEKIENESFIQYRDVIDGENTKRGERNLIPRKLDNIKSRHQSDVTSKL